MIRVLSASAESAGQHWLLVLISDALPDDDAFRVGNM